MPSAFVARELHREKYVDGAPCLLHLKNTMNKRIRAQHTKINTIQIRISPNWNAARLFIEVNCCYCFSDRLKFFFFFFALVKGLSQMARTDISIYIYDVASLKNWTLYKPIYLKGQKNKFKSFEYNSKDSYTELMINAIVQMDHTASPNSFECVYRSFASWFIQTILLIFPHASWQHLAYNYRERPRCCRRRRRHHRHFNIYTYYIDDME